MVQQRLQNDPTLTSPRTKYPQKCSCEDAGKMDGAISNMLPLTHAGDAGCAALRHGKGTVSWASARPVVEGFVRYLLSLPGEPLTYQCLAMGRYHQDAKHTPSAQVTHVSECPDTCMTTTYPSNRVVSHLYRHVRRTAQVASSSSLATASSASLALGSSTEGKSSVASSAYWCCHLLGNVRCARCDL